MEVVFVPNLLLDSLCVCVISFITILFVSLLPPTINAFVFWALFIDLKFRLWSEMISSEFEVIYNFLAQQIKDYMLLV